MQIRQETAKLNKIEEYQVIGNIRKKTIAYSEPANDAAAIRTILNQPEVSTTMRTHIKTNAKFLMAISSIYRIITSSNETAPLKTCSGVVFTL